MERTSFINEFVSIGMYEYFNDIKENIFERHIIECLCDIYGKDSLKKVYENNSESEFMSLLLQYGITNSTYDNFLRDTVRYEKFKSENEKDPTKKSDIASSVEQSIITMFLYKSMIIEPTLEALSHFENDLLNDFSVIKLHFTTSINPNKTREFWEKKKKVLSSNVELEEIKIQYLDEFTYARFGIKIKDVKEMDQRMVEKLNQSILAKLESENKNAPEVKKTKITGTTVLSSGNGFVDALLIASIIATEISIGMIYLFLNM